MAGEVPGRMVGLGREVAVDRMVGGSAVPVLGLVVRDVVHSCVWVDVFVRIGPWVLPSVSSELPVATSFAGVFSRSGTGAGGV